MFKKLFHFFLFSSLYIAGCAVLMVYQTNRLLHLHYDFLPCYLFVFSAPSAATIFTGILHLIPLRKKSACAGRSGTNGCMFFIRYRNDRRLHLCMAVHRALVLAGNGCVTYFLVFRPQGSLLPFYAAAKDSGRQNDFSGCRLDVCDQFSAGYFFTCFVEPGRYLVLPGRFF